MEIRRLEVDFDANILKINGQVYINRAIIVTLPGHEGWLLSRMFNVGHVQESAEEIARLCVSWDMA